MGTDLFILGNHKIQFKNRNYNEIATEIKSVLDNHVFSNAEFLRLVALNWADSSPKDARKIRSINTTKYWKFRPENEIEEFYVDYKIEFWGPFDLEIFFDENYITFWYPRYRYWDWFQLDEPTLTDEWRKYFKQVVNLFGGDKFVYLADNSHHLNDYLYFEGTFEEMEIALFNKYGSSKTTFEEVANDFKNSYFLDDFKSIDWTKSHNLEEFLPEPDDKSSIDFDLEEFVIKSNLIDLDFQNEILLHKLIDGKAHFYHLARYEGLLCIHSGQVGGQENLEVKLDEYAPFTYDRLEMEFKAEGYISELVNWYEIYYEIYFNGLKNLISWEDALSEFENELKWNGLGGKGGRSCNENVKNISFYAVDEQLALKLLLELGEKYKATGKIEVYRNEYSDENESTSRILIYKNYKY